MTRATFEIAFEGEPFDDGEIDVRDLAPTLLAFGNVIQAANKALNGDRAEASLKVSATDKGSFVALLSVDVSWVTDMLDLVAAHPDRVLAADRLMDLLIKAGTIGAPVIGLLATLSFLRGRRPEKVEPRGDGTTELVINHTTILVDDRTVTLMRDMNTRTAIEDLGRKASSVRGLERLRIAERDDEEPLRLTNNDFPALRVPQENGEPEVESTRREAWLKVVSAHFREGYKWRFTDGGERPFTAEVEDVEFRNSVHDGRVTLSANDALRCRLREEQTITGTGLAKAVFIEEVLDHRPGARQMELI